MTKLSRRALAQLASAAAANAFAQQPESSEYTGPLTGLEKKADGRALDPLPYALRLLDAAPRRMQFAAQSKSQAEAWQKRLRPKLVELLGGFPSAKAPLQPLILETRVYPRYRREKVIFDSKDGVSVLAYILTPTGARTPVPAVICVPGHGRGVDDVVGIDEKGRDRTDKSGYQHDFAVQIAEAGMAAIAIEPMGFGCRRDEANRKRGLGRSSCQPVAGTALLLGKP